MERAYGTQETAVCIIAGLKSGDTKCIEPTALEEESKQKNNKIKMHKMK